VLGRRSIDYIVVNKRFPTKQLRKYELKGQHPVRYDLESLKKLGIAHVVVEDLIREDELVRHDPAKLAAVVMDIVREAVPAASSRRWPAEFEKLRETFQMFNEVLVKHRKRGLAPWIKRITITKNTTSW